MRERDTGRGTGMYEGLELRQGSGDSGTLGSVVPGEEQSLRRSYSWNSRLMALRILRAVGNFKPHYVRFSKVFQKLFNSLWISRPKEKDEDAGAPGGWIFVQARRASKMRH